VEDLKLILRQREKYKKIAMAVNSSDKVLKFRETERLERRNCNRGTGGEWLGREKFLQGLWVGGCWVASKKKHAL